MLMHWLIVYHFHFRWDRLGEKSFIIQTLITSLSVKLVHLKPISHDIPTFTGCAFLFSQSLQRNLNQFFFFLVKSVGQICFISSSISKIHWRQGLSYKNYSWLVSVFISSIVPDSGTRPISANVLCTHKWKEEKKYCIYNTPHSYIPKSSVCASLCVSASTEIQSLQSTSDLICRARPTHWDDSLEPAPTNSDWQRRNLGCLPRQ